MIRTHQVLRLALAVVAVASVAAFAQIAVIRIETQNGVEPGGSTSSGGGGGWDWGGGGGWDWGGGIPGMGTTSQNYTKVTSFKLENANGQTLLTLGNTSDSIRIRGNSTASAAKKPYRIKFGEKQGLFGRTPARSWVLLANFYDGTFALNAIAFRLGRMLGLEFTNSTEFVEVYINGKNKGIYHLTEQMQVNPGRVDIRDKKDWLVEFDYHDAEQGQIKFNSAVYNLPTRIRSPEVESNFTVNNPEVKFVADEINALCNNMNQGGFPTNGYRDRIDLESYAKYVLIQQLIDNFDFNNKVNGQGMTGQNMTGQPGSNYAYRDSTGKIKAGPLWDFDLSAGVVENGFPKHYTTYQEPIRPRNSFYQRIWDDPAFKAKFKKIWDKHQNDFKTVIPSLIDSISRVVGPKIGNNVNQWANNQMMAFGDSYLTQQQHNTEVQGFKTWWGNRLTFFGNEINKLNIDVNADVDQSSTVTVVFDAKGGSPTPTTQTVAIGAKVTRPTNPTKSGETFNGWYTDGGASTETWLDEWNFDTRTVTGKVTLYAKWGTGTTTPPSNSFPVVFNSNSGSSVPTQTVAQGQKVSKPIDPTRQGYVFDGWYKDANLANAWNFDSDVVNSSVTLYAKWSIPGGTATFAVTFSMNGSQSAQPVPPTQNVTQGGKVTKPAQDPARNNYVFGGWYKDANTTTPWDFDADLVNSNVTIYAKWNQQGAAVTFTFTFNTNGGSAVTPQTVNQGAKATKPADPTRNEFTFAGWYRDEALTSEWNFDESVNANTTIYAKWSPANVGIITRDLKVNGKSLTAIRNGLIINTANGASMTVFGLNGSVVRKQAFARGNHTVRLGDLPSGMYLVKSNVDGVKRVVRVAVR